MHARGRGIVGRAALCRQMLLMLASLLYFWPGAHAAEQSTTREERLELVYRTVVLPRGLVGQVYRPRQIVRGGTAPYVVEFTEGELPMGMSLASDGQLSGTPLVVGTSRFTLRIVDAALPPVSIEQRYSLGVDASLPKPAPPPRPAPLTPPLPAEDPVQLVVYRLESADLKQLSEARTDAQEDAAESLEDPFAPRQAPRPKPAGPDAAQLTELLTPLLDVEYPTRALFRAALEAQYCAVNRARFNQGTISVTQLRDACPSRDALLDGLMKWRGELPVRAGSANLLPVALADEITQLAEKRFAPAKALPPRWRGDDCGCIARKPANQVYGIYPFWSAQEQVQPVDFGKLTRITYAGASLTASGDYVRPAHWDDQTRDFARRAQRHGTQLDLMIVRRDWQRLLQMNERQQQEFVERAASGALAMIDTPLTDAFSRLKGYLLPFGHGSRYVYDGITVFFDDTDVTDAEQFRNLFRRFMRELITRMQASGRAYALNIAVVDQRFGLPGAYDFAELLTYVEAAERPDGKPMIDAETQLAFRGTTDISVRVLVLVSDPTSPNHKLLRARLDDTDALHGHARIAVLDRTVPILFHSSGSTPVALEADSKERLDNDLAYINWQFGGVGFWPVPIRTLGAGQDVIDRLGHIYYPSDSFAPGEGLCRWICPNHVALRLLLEVLVLTGLVSVALYFWSWPVRRLGRRYVLYLWIGGIVTLLFGLALLRCDPDAAELRDGNDILYALLGLSVLAGAYLTLRPRVSLP